MAAFGFKFRDDHHWDDDIVFVEPQERPRVG
jgi:hypothetical protein